MRWFVIATLAVLALATIGYGWHRLSLYAARRDWIYNKHNPRPKGLTSLGLLEEIYQPAIRHVVDEIVSEKARGSQDESGDKPFDSEE